MYSLVDETEENSKIAIDMVNKITKSSEDFSKKMTAWNNSMISKLETLRNKIAKARQIADGVNNNKIEVNLSLNLLLF